MVWFSPNENSKSTMQRWWSKSIFFQRQWFQMPSLGAKAKPLFSEISKMGCILTTCRSFVANHSYGVALGVSICPCCPRTMPSSRNASAVYSVTFGRHESKCIPKNNNSLFGYSPLSSNKIDESARKRATDHFHLSPFTILHVRWWDASRHSCWHVIQQGDASVSSVVTPFGNKLTSSIFSCPPWKWTKDNSECLVRVDFISPQHKEAYRRQSPPKDILFFSDGGEIIGTRIVVDRCHGSGSQSYDEFFFLRGASDEPNKI